MDEEKGPETTEPPTTDTDGPRPKLIVFDLDYTLWPFWVDTHVDPPFRTLKGGVIDKRGKKVSFYKEVPEVLQYLHSEGYDIGVASRTSEVEGAGQLIELFNWDKFIKYREIYPGCKLNHFKRFHKDSGIEYKEMLFFDDEHRNIRDLLGIGVCSILVEKGVTMDLVKESLKQFAEERLTSKST